MILPSVLPRARTTIMAHFKAARKFILVFSGQIFLEQCSIREAGIELVLAQKGEALEDEQKRHFRHKHVTDDGAIP